MKYLITGGCGFIGSSFATTLLSRGDHVILLDNLSRKGAAENLIHTRSLYPQVEFVHADIRADFPKICPLMDKVDVVYHLAGQVAVTTSVTNPKEDFEINALGTLNLLEAIRLSKKMPSIIYSSTNKVYGSLGSIRIVERSKRYEYEDLSEGVTESQPLEFHSPYGCSKGAADQYVRDYAETYGIKTVVMRQSCIYGRRQFGIEDQGWISWFTINAILDRGIIVYGDGKQVRDVLFVDDLFEAWDSALRHIDEISGAVYNVGGGPDNVLSLLELIDWLEKFMNRKISFRFEDWRPGDQRVYISDIRKIKRELDWEPKTPALEGVEVLYNWVWENREYFSEPREGERRALRSV